MSRSTLARNRIILLHITDFHFGDKQPVDFSSGALSFDKIGTLVIQRLKEFNPSSLIIAIGGDIPNKADDYYYLHAGKFFKQLKDAFQTSQINYMICPGNHDIDEQAESPLGAFNQFAFGLTVNSDYLFSAYNTSALVELDSWSLVSVNTAFRENRKTAEVYEPHLDAILKKARFPVILLQHHHLIPMYLGDHSAVQNAYREIRICLNHNVRLLLHGHVHASDKLTIGHHERKFDMVGCGALLPGLTSGYLNQFNIFVLNEDHTIEIHPFEIVMDGEEGKPETRPKPI